MILRKAVEWGRIEDSPARVVKTDSVQECRSPQEHRHQGIAVYGAEVTPALARSLSERHQIELYGDAEQNRVYSLATEQNQY